MVTTTPTRRRSSGLGRKCQSKISYNDEAEADAGESSSSDDDYDYNSKEDTDEATSTQSRKKRTAVDDDDDAEFSSSDDCNSHDEDEDATTPTQPTRKSRRVVRQPLRGVVDYVEDDTEESNCSDAYNTQEEDAETTPTQPTRQSSRVLRKKWPRRIVRNVLRQQQREVMLVEERRQRLASRKRRNFKRPKERTMTAEEPVPHWVDDMQMWLQEGGENSSTLSETDLEYLMMQVRSLVSGFGISGRKDEPAFHEGIKVSLQSDFDHMYDKAQQLDRSRVQGLQFPICQLRSYQRYRLAKEMSSKVEELEEVDLGRDE